MKPKPLIASSALVVAVIIIDQLSKSWAEKRFCDSYGDVSLGPFQLRSLDNYGILMGHMAEMKIFIILLVVSIIIAFAIYFFRHQTMPGLWLAFGLFVGGAISNVIDRLTSGAVYDFIGLGNVIIFNLADVAIFVSALIFLYCLANYYLALSRQKVNQ